MLLSAFGFSNFTAELGYSLPEAFRLSGGFYWKQELWAVAGRLDPSSRLFFSTKKVAVGFQLPLSRLLVVELTGGYSFGRSFFEGTSSTNAQNQVLLDTTWFAGATLHVPLSGLVPTGDQIHLRSTDKVDQVPPAVQRPPTI